MFANVALPVPHRDYFTYIIPESMKGIIVRGMLVNVPFGNQTIIGMVISVSDKIDHPVEKIKSIIALGDPELRLSDEMIEFVSIVADYYITTPGMVLKAALPPSTLQRKKAYYYPGLINSDADFGAGIIEFLNAIRDNPGKISHDDLRRYKGISRTEVDDLIQRGAISLSSHMAGSSQSKKGKEKWIRAKLEPVPASIKFTPKAELLLNHIKEFSEGIKVSSLEEDGFSLSTVSTLIKKNLAEFYLIDKKLADTGHLRSIKDGPVVELTLWQQAALHKIETAIYENKYKGFLLYGVTSSGKTQIYLEAAQRALGLGKSVLVLVPEISLTPQIITRFEKFIGVPPLIWHSHLTATERLSIYKQANSGEKCLMIGARSAIFAPLKNLGLIVVDEEQDHSYKQDDPSPRYNARDMALERGRLSNCAVLLGSATPSLESYHKTRNGELELLTLPQRIAGKSSPKVEIISTARKPELSPAEVPVIPKGFWPVTERLYQEISIRLKKKEQVIILLNRRGYSSAVVCFECGWVGKCPDCEIGWTYHKTKDRMICHFCGKEQKGLSACPNCNSTRLSFRGAGTQRLEETLKKILPSARTVRLDSDVASSKWESRDILDDFGQGKYQILLGTQMVAKGHHFPRVSLVAIINADIGLSLPDFRASERVLQLLTQASGRAGRSMGKGDPGAVVVQCFSSDDPVFGYLTADNYTGFLENEAKIRSALGYPPFKRLAQIMVSSSNSTRASNVASSLKDELLSNIVDTGIGILGPAQASIFKRGNQYRYQLLMKIDLGLNPNLIFKKMDNYINSLKGVTVRIDIDPVSFD